MKPTKKGVTFALDKIRGDALLSVLKRAICPPRKLIYSPRQAKAEKSIAAGSLYISRALSYV